MRAEEITRLQAEADTAARWQALSDKKVQSESLWYFLQYEDAKRESDAARAAIAQLENEITAKRRDLETLESHSEDLAAAERSADAAHRNASDAFRESEKELARLEGEMSRIVERRRLAERTFAEAEAALKEKRALAEELEVRIESAAQKEERLAAELEELDELNAARDEALEGAQSAEEESRMRAESAGAQLARARTESKWRRPASNLLVSEQRKWQTEWLVSRLMRRMRLKRTRMKKHWRRSQNL